jgi:hypothetical protein
MRIFRAIKLRQGKGESKRFAFFGLSGRGHLPYFIGGAK